MSFVNASEKEEIASRLQETEEWLYEEGDDESEKVYLSKMEELKMVRIKKSHNVSFYVNPPWSITHSHTHLFYVFL